MIDELIAGNSSTDLKRFVCKNQCSIYNKMPSVNCSETYLLLRVTSWSLFALLAAARILNSFDPQLHLTTIASFLILLYPEQAFLAKLFIILLTTVTATLLRRKVFAVKRGQPDLKGHWVAGERTSASRFGFFARALFMTVWQAMGSG
jgi:hypothetical protein